MARLLPFFLLLGCAGGDDVVVDDLILEDSGGDPVETCDNGVDEDGNGLVDCADDACAGDASCSWPTSLNLDATLFFDANALAKFGGVNDCTTRFTAPLTLQYPNDCSGCDRIYQGPFTYVSDDCPDDPNNPRPTEGEYGMVFTSAGTWTAWYVNQGTWTEMGAANDDGSAYVYRSTDPVNYEGTEVGELTSTFRFSQ